MFTLDDMFAPKDHEGHYAFRKGCPFAWAIDAPLVTGITFPKGCGIAWAVNLPLVTGIKFPKGCTYARAENLPLVTSITFPEGCAYARAENLPALLRIVAPEDVTVYLDGQAIGAGHPIRRQTTLTPIMASQGEMK